MRKVLKLIMSLVMMGSMWVPSVQAESPVNIVTTFYPVYYLTKQIAEPDANVSLMIKGGQDAHSFEPSTQEIVKIQEADLFVYQSPEMEFFVESLLPILESENVPVINATEGIEFLPGSHDHDHDDHDHDHDHDDHDHDHDHEHEEGHDHDHEHEEEGHDHDHEHEEEGHDHDHDHDHDGHDHSHEFDPHTWLSPKYYIEQAKVVMNGLIELDPENEANYRERTEALIAELEQLDQEFQEKLSTLEDRRIVVQHPAFGYLAHEYQLEQIGITGLLTQSDPSAETMANMINFIKEENISVIYVDPSIPTDVSEIIAQEAGVEVRYLRTLETISEEEEMNNVSYMELMRQNLESLIS